MLEGALSGPIETKFLMYVNARSMVMRDQQALINSLKSILEGEGCIKNLCLRGHCPGLLKPNVLCMSMRQIYGHYRSACLVSIGRIYP